LAPGRVRGSPPLFSYESIFVMVGWYNRPVRLRGTDHPKVPCGSRVVRGLLPAVVELCKIRGYAEILTSAKSDHLRYFNGLDIAKIVCERPSFAKRKRDIRLRHGQPRQNFIVRLVVAQQQSSLCHFSVPLSRTGQKRESRPRQAARHTRPRCAGCRICAGGDQVMTVSTANVPRRSIRFDSLRTCIALAL
jgi:hypothetical protein